MRVCSCIVSGGDSQFLPYENTERGGEKASVLGQEEKWAELCILCRTPSCTKAVSDPGHSLTQELGRWPAGACASTETQGVILLLKLFRFISQDGEATRGESERKRTLRELSRETSGDSDVFGM